MADRAGKLRKSSKNMKVNFDRLPPSVHQGKFSEARKVLKAAAQRNGVKISQHLLNPEPAKDGESAAVEER